MSTGSFHPGFQCKIVFVLGKDEAFRNQICDKICEEYNYTVSYTDNLLEVASQTNNRKNFLMNGFPSTVDQAINFEQNICECQKVIYFEDQKTEDEEEKKEDADVAGSGLQEVIEKYKLFGKVRVINASQDMEDVYRDTRHALLPEVMFLLGPKASGKTTVGAELAEKTNMSLMKFDDFVKEHSLQTADDETVTFELIKKLLDEVTPRILVENFPQNVVQAK